MFKKIKNVLSHPFVKFLFSLSILILIAINVDLSAIIIQLQQFSLKFVIFYLLVTFVILLIVSFRWLILNKKKFNFFDLYLFFLASLKGSYYNIIMPSTVGGDLLKGAGLQKIQVSAKKIYFTIFLDRVIGLIGLIFMGNIFLMIGLLRKKLNIDHKILLFSVVLLIISGILLLIMMKQSLIRQLNKILSHIEIKRNFFDKVIQIIKRINQYFQYHQQAVFQALGLSMISQFLTNYLIYLAAQNLQMNISLIDFFTIMPIMMLLVNLPISFAGLGTTEVVFIYFFSQLGISDETILALTSLMAIIRILVGLIAGVMVHLSSIWHSSFDKK